MSHDPPPPTYARQLNPQGALMSQEPPPPTYIPDSLEHLGGDGSKQTNLFFASDLVGCNGARNEKVVLKRLGTQL